MPGLRIPSAPSLDTGIDANRLSTELHLAVDLVAEADDNVLMITTFAGTRTVPVTGSRMALTGLQPNVHHILRSVARSAGLPNAASVDVEIWTRPSDLTGELTVNPMGGGACLVSWRLQSHNSDATAPVVLDFDVLLPDGASVAFLRGTGLEGAISGAFAHGTVLACTGYSLNAAGQRNETLQTMSVQVHGAAAVVHSADPAGQIVGLPPAGRWAQGMQGSTCATGRANL